MKNANNRIRMITTAPYCVEEEQVGNRWGYLFMGILISVLVAACGNASAAENVDDNALETGSLSDIHEFGLTMEQLAAKVDAVEEHISSCMSDAGFDYVAVDFNTVRNGMLADKSIPGLSEEEYLSQFGFGISTQYTGQAPQHTDAHNPAKIGLGEQNVRVFSQLSGTDQIAYNHTLFGEHVDATLAVMLEAEDFSRAGGCTRAAIEQAFSPEQVSVSYTNPKDRLIEQDPRMVDAVTKFASCMRDAGFNYSHPDDVEVDIKNRLDSILDGGTLDGLSAERQADLQQLQGEERAVAVATFECEETYIHPVQEQIEEE